MDELEEEYRKLEKKRASGAISEDEYWEELRLLERRIDDFGHRGGKDVFVKSLRSAATKAVLFTLPIAILGLLSYLLFFHYPSPRGIGIDVTGAGVLPATRGEKEVVYRALELMKKHSPDEYALVDAYVDTIEVSGALGLGFLGGRISGYYTGASGKSIRMVRGFECPAHCVEDGWNGRDLLVAEIILHEACHSMQYHTGVDFNEPQCYGMQFEFAKKAGPMLWRDFDEEMFVYEHPAAGFTF
ncbi:MAG: hypothetical protein ACE5G7_01735 [Candidatus Hydrothermarchaeaceae archaeon]